MPTICWNTESITPTKITVKPKEKSFSDFTSTVDFISRSISAAFEPLMRVSTARALLSRPVRARKRGDSGTKHTSTVNSRAT